MNKTKTIMIPLALAVLLASPVQAATKVGVIGAAHPDVVVKSANGNQRSVAVGDAIYQNDEISTNAKGAAQLMFLDKSALTVSPNSTIIIDSFVYDPATKDGDMVINGAKGAFRLIGGALTKKNPVKIKTPVSTIGIRGGIVDAHISNGNTQAVFIFGDEMSMTDAAGRVQSTQQAGSGFGANSSGIVALPPSTVQALIQQSPVENAVNSAPTQDTPAILQTSPTGDNQAGNTAGGADTASSQAETSDKSPLATPNVAQDGVLNQANDVADGTVSPDTLLNTNEVSPEILTRLNGDNTETPVIPPIVEVTPETPTNETLVPPTTTQPIATVRTQDRFGNALPWLATPELPTIDVNQQLRGRFTLRNGTSEVTRGDIDAVDRSVAGSRVVDIRTEELERRISGSPVTPAAGVEKYAVGTLPWLANTDQRQTLSASQIQIETLDTVENTGQNFSGSGYRTGSNSFHFYQFGWDDATDGSRQEFSGYMNYSPIFDATDLAAQRVAYDTIMTNSENYSGGVDGIIEYDLLPMFTNLSGGLFDHNAANGYAGSQNDTGLLVDWSNRHFLGGDIRFAGANPLMRVGFGSINGEGTAVTNLNLDGDIAMNGVNYRLGQGNSFNVGTPRSRVEMTVATESLSAGSLSSPYDAFVIDSNGPAGHIPSRQAAVIGDGAASVLSPSTHLLENGTQTGYTAGIVTNGSGASRIYSGGAGGVSVDTMNDGRVSAHIYTDLLDTGSAMVVNSGDIVATKNAALRKNLYAAEVNNPEYKGAIATMHPALSASGGNPVCSNCEFAHWGVWQVDKFSSGTKIAETALVPYVAGRKTTYGELSSTSVFNLGTVTYNGQAAANIHVFDGTNASLHNQIGQMTANVDLANRVIPANGLQINFANIGNESSRTLNLNNSNPVTFPGVADFNNAGLSGAFRGNGISNIGQISGSFYGDQAQELGGAFQATGVAGTETFKAGGIYLGKRP